MLDLDDLDEAEAEAAKEEEENEEELPPVEGRPMRVLGIHGQGSNSTIMKWQTDMLRRICKDGELTEWDFIDGPVEKWDYEGAGNTYTDPASEADGRHSKEHPIMIGMAQGKPFVGWYSVRCDDHSARPWIEKMKDSSVDYVASEELEASCDFVLKHIQDNGPYDIVVAFSSGTVMLNVLTAQLLERGEPVPWRLSVLFSPCIVRDTRLHRLFEQPLKHRVIMGWGRCGPGGMDSLMNHDWTNHIAKKQVSQWYFKKPIVLPDGDHAHEIPRSSHDHEMTCKRMAKEMFQICGMKAPFPTKVTKILPGGESVEEDI